MSDAPDGDGVLVRMRALVEYTVIVRCFVDGDRLMMGVAFDGISFDNAEDRRHAALDLRAAATMLEEEHDAER